MDDKIILTDEETGEEIAYYVIEETKVAGCNYLLVTDSPDGDECLILKDTSAPEDSDAMYEFVEDEKEMEYLAKIFEQLLDDVDIEI